MLFRDVLGLQGTLEILLPAIHLFSIGLESPFSQLGLELTLVWNNHLGDWCAEERSESQPGQQMDKWKVSCSGWKSEM